MDKIKCKSNQRRPAAIYIDLSQEKCPEILRSKNRMKKFPRTVNINYFLIHISACNLSKFLFYRIYIFNTFYYGLSLIKIKKLFIN